MASLVYTLGFAVTLLCAVLLLRAYVRVRSRLLFWSGLCFTGLTLSNGLLVIDLIFVPGTVMARMIEESREAGATRRGGA